MYAIYQFSVHNYLSLTRANACWLWVWTNHEAFESRRFQHKLDFIRCLNIYYAFEQYLFFSEIMAKNLESIAQGGVIEILDFFSLEIHLIWSNYFWSS